MAHLSPFRDYRLRTAAREDEARFQVVVGQSDLLIAARQDLSETAWIILSRLRGEIEAFGSLHPPFLESLTPVAAPDTAPRIVRRMARAAEAVGVGPMASVAGAVAQGVAEELADASPDVLVENGGDLFILGNKPRLVGLLAEPESGMLLGVELDGGPAAFCSSSGRIGHSLSLGKGDLVTVRSEDAALADAAATALANRLNSPDDLRRVTEQAARWRSLGVRGVFAQCGGSMAVWGDMELTALG